jgi:hypothetical protein
MEYVWILAVLCNGFVLIAWLLLNGKSPMAPALARLITTHGQRTPTR